MFGYGSLEWAVIIGTVFFLIVIPTAIFAWVWWLSRKAEKDEQAKGGSAP
ncbi:hypothetical protein [Persicimonas caeni]|nr:hypothetical protein [Persicimonas caeni]